MTFTQKCIAVLVSAAGVLPLAAQRGPAPAGPAAVLSPGTCVPIAQGGTISLRWNPAFSNATTVHGIRKVTLTFAAAGSEESSRRGHGGLVFHADARNSVAPIVAEPDGFYSVSFPVDLRFAAAGEYRLVGVEVVPRVDPDSSGPAPEMTASPVQSSFCVSLATPVLPERGR